MNKGAGPAMFWLCALFALQCALTRPFPGGPPPLAQVALVFFALTRGAGFGFWMGAFLGLLFDVFAPGSFGLQATVWSLAGCLAGTLSSKLFRESLWTQFLLVPSVSLAAAILSAFALPADESATRWLFVLRAFSWREWLLPALMAPFVFAFLRRVTSPRERPVRLYR